MGYPARILSRAVLRLLSRAFSFIAGILLVIPFAPTVCEAEWVLFGHAQRRCRECVELAESRRFAEVRECVDEFLSDYPHSRWSEHLRFLAAKLETDVEKAEEKLYNFVVEFPDGPYSDEAHFALGELYELNNKADRAQRYYLRVYEFFQTSGLKDEAVLRAARCMLLNNQPEDAARLMENYLTGAVPKPWRARAHGLYADALYQCGDYLKSQREYREVISSHETPRNAPERCYIRVAEIYEKLGDYECAVQTYRQFLRLYPESTHRADAEKRLVLLASAAELEFSEEGRTYVVEAGTSDSDHEAMALVARLRNIGYRAYMVSKQGNRKQIFSVRLGPYDSRDSAVAVVERLLEETGIASTVLPQRMRSERGTEVE